MIVSTFLAATVAAAAPQATPAPEAGHADHQAMQHGEKTMACCEKMAKGEGCDCCKGQSDETAKSHGEHKQ